MVMHSFVAFRACLALNFDGSVSFSEFGKVDICCLRLVKLLDDVSVILERRFAICCLRLLGSVCIGTTCFCVARKTVGCSYMKILVMTRVWLSICGKSRFSFRRANKAKFYWINKCFIESIKCFIGPIKCFIE